MTSDTALEFALAQGFASRLAKLARGAGASTPAAQWVERAAFAISRATALGHVCIALDSVQDAALLPQDADAPGFGAHADAAAARAMPAPPPAAASVSQIRAHLLDSGLACDGSGASSALLPLVLDARNRLYLARYYDFERQLARALVARAASGPFGAAHAQLDDSVQALFTAAPPGEIDWQRVAVSLALMGRLTVISGGPGTGKTTTVVAILAALLAQAEAHRAPLRIALAAPTGKAAQRMQEALLERAGALPAAAAARLPAQSYTLHRLLGVGPGGQFRHHRNAPLPYDVVVIDEASMIDIALAARLVDALAPDARLILLGDKDQLAAVEAGAVFAELSARPTLSPQRLAQLAAQMSVAPRALAAAWPGARTGGADAAHTAAQDTAYVAGHDAARRAGQPAGQTAQQATGPAPEPLADCVVWLERNYRFGLDSAIGQLSLAIRDGQVQAALAIVQGGGSDSAVLHADDDATLAAAALAQLSEGYADYIGALACWQQAGASDPHALFEAFNRFRVLCAVRAGARGVERLNLELAQRLRRALAQQGDTAIAAPETLWYMGRAVMVTRNDYALGLFNGDIGIALPAGPGDATLRVWFRAGDGHYRAVSPAALPPHDTAFAMTVHKSQGSEFRRVALVMPASASRVLTRELVYTAVTRARTAVAIYASPEVLSRAIATRTARDSGLAARLQEAAYGPLERR